MSVGGVNVYWKYIHTYLHYRRNADLSVIPCLNALTNDLKIRDKPFKTVQISEKHCFLSTSMKK